jgi:hypothetical protein
MLVARWESDIDSVLGTGQNLNNQSKFRDFTRKRQKNGDSQCISLKRWVGTDFLLVVYHRLQRLTIIRSHEFGSQCRVTQVCRPIPPPKRQAAHVDRIAPRAVSARWRVLQEALRFW